MELRALVREFAAPIDYDPDFSDCPFCSQIGDNRHADDCPVTRARALLGETTE
jgi:hypothetical protein